MDNTVTYIKRGESEKKILVMSPVMPEWDNGDFFQPLTEYFLKHGYSVFIVDTLSLSPQLNEPISYFSQRWAKELESHGPFEIVAGSALGGALAQLLVSKHLKTKASCLLLISAPNNTDAELRKRLAVIAELAREGDLDQAMRVLAYRVLPDTCQPLVTLAPIKSNGSLQQQERLYIGFSYLYELDIRPEIKEFTGRVLNIIGERSQLVKACNAQLDESPAHRTVVIPGGGMRPLIDDALLVISAIEKHLFNWQENNNERG
ncbi:alpha/beta hydrolase [Agrobacterium tumefaciens]|uniref:alpha/beta hydrolase n=1 Tax=Agrobacterium tumefaciens TaxID=358 RepID=UPI0021D3993F|nr:alpha/beta hydrolase [Agrobacterium tumefaciens]UXS01907.1 alpha/beta hydrolase [Agrobacterium tumefaciens]